MKKIFIIPAILAVSALIFSSALAANYSRNIAPQVASVSRDEMTLPCQVLFVFVRWGLQHPQEYLEIADFNKDKVVNPIDLSIFMRERWNGNWCAEQLGWENLVRWEN